MRRLDVEHHMGDGQVRRGRAFRLAAPAAPGFEPFERGLLCIGRHAV